LCTSPFRHSSRRSYKAFDIVVAAQLLEHCYAPRNFLCEIHRRVNAGGLLVVASTYAWDAAVTPPQEWLGGDEAGAASASSASSASSADAVRALLTAEGRFVELAGEQCDLPFVVREQARKFTHGLAHVMFFERQ
jgi:SAM-dependent methyltransferase